MALYYTIQYVVCNLTIDWMACQLALSERKGPGHGMYNFLQYTPGGKKQQALFLLSSRLCGSLFTVTQKIYVGKHVKKILHLFFYTKYERILSYTLSYTKKTQMQQSLVIVAPLFMLIFRFIFLPSIFLIFFQACTLCPLTCPAWSFVSFVFFNHIS